MCGIVGIVDYDKKSVDELVLRRMVSSIRHRGPDGDGYHAAGNVGLAHCRLSIIDLSDAGQQPIFNEDGNLLLVYNGEIYNYLELTHELKGLGHIFSSSTDSEVVLHAYEEWGADALSRFNGMFAFAIWDKVRKEIFVARDRYGIKPLYYGYCDNKFIFASEQKAILAHDSMRRRIDLEAMLEYFTFQNIFTDKTFFKDIKLFPPGHWARVSCSGGMRELQPVCFWDFSFEEPEHPLREEEYLEQLDFLFRQAVNRQLVSDVGVGAYLSGGIDSGSITAIAAKSLPYMKTFTCGFDLTSASGLELAFDERAQAEYMSYLFKTEHYEMVLKAGDMERVMPQLAWHLEEPRVGQSYPNFYASKLASAFSKVVLGGTGGDELFGGYPWRYYRAVVNDDFEHYVDKYYKYWHRLIPNSDIQKVFAPVWGDVKDVWTRDIFRNVFHSHADLLSRPEDYINHSLYFEAKTFLHGLLIVEDKLSMAHGLESRVPFLDNDLVDFAMKVPVSMKLRNLKKVVKLNENEPGPKTSQYYQKTQDGKLLLRRVMERYVPDTVTSAVKQGFSGPDASWFHGESLEYVKRRIFDPKARIYEYLDKKSVCAFVDEHLQGKENRRLLIWSLLNVEQWCESYLI